MSRASAVLDRLRPSSPHVVLDASPPAERRGRAWWRDGRVIGGVAVLTVCTLAGARLLSAGGESVAVWQATRDLAAGATVSESDVVAVLVSPTVAAAYSPAGAMPPAPLQRPVLAGEFVPVVDPATPADSRWVTLPVEPLHAPADLAPGERVDVWATSDLDLTVAPRPTLALASALVTAVTVDAMGVGGEYGVTVQIAPSDAEPLLAAVRSGAIDLVRTPVVTP